MVTIAGYQPAARPTEFRTVDRHGHGTLDLESSKHPIGATWRNWSLVSGALPARIAELRCDCGNGIITDAQRLKAERQWGLALKRARSGRAA